ncbi:aldo/keto reductase [Aquirufa aurantiipilula]|uniref:Aldo/keto reductase n=1 Tax=Aquirufa aurantiipilula TaxID=2696561 RepID=A0ABT6BP54_9BACT|nr:aldo/keto reductase [Aquirufa aurantiipilula]MDF5690823.1 aldo/keto reductase [Aquirufa aurantiipilula]
MIKLALGTVQFGLPYGINNQFGVPEDGELSNIFSLAKEAGIDVLDSAQGYGNAEERIGKLSKNEFHVITKFKKLESPLPFHLELKESLRKLKSDSVYGYMAHDGDLLIGNPAWWDSLKKAKELGLVKKIGYSLYSVNQLESLLAKQMIPDLIQFPYNVLDRRFESYLSHLASLGVEIHTRSVYLQGLLHMDPNQIPIYVRALHPYLIQVREIVNKYDVSLSQVCLGFCIQNPFINKVVIGVDNVFQLTENIDLCKKESLTEETMNELLSIEVKDKNLLNPANWK